MNPLAAIRKYLDQRRFQASAKAAARAQDSYVTWQWDDEPQRLDTLAVWIGADTASIDAAFTVLADAAESAEFAAIIRRHAKGRQSQ